MKSIKKLAIMTIAAVAFLPAIQVKAADDGITASPKVRQMMDSLKTAPTSDTATAPAKPDQTVAASPKVLAQRSSQPATAGTEAVSVGYQATGGDGITASPKVRQVLNERGATFQIAPVK